MTTKFEVGKKYSSEFPIEVIKRTEKFVTFKTECWGVQRAKIQSSKKGVESILYKCWLIDADDPYNEKDAYRMAMDRAWA